MMSKIKMYETSLPVDRDEASRALKEEIWPTLRSEWSDSKLVAEALTSGYVNVMTVYRTVDDAEKKNGMVVRIFNMDMLPDEYREMEFIKMQIAEHMGCFPTIRASFKNGVIYDYAPGRCLKADDQKNPLIVRQVARSLAQFHWFTPTAIANLVDRKGNKTTFKIENMFMEDLKSNFEQCPTTSPNKIDEERRKYDNMIKEMAEEIPNMEKFLDGFDLPLVNNHSDFHMNNIIYDDDSDRVTLVDYEFNKGSGNFAMFDFGMLFNMHHLNDVGASKIDVGDEGQSEETKQLWVKNYMIRKYELEGRDSKDITDDVMEMWMTHLAILEVIVRLYSAISCLPAVTMDFEFSVLTACYRMMDLFREEKHKLADLKEKYIKLSSQMK